MSMIARSWGLVPALAMAGLLLWPTAWAADAQTSLQRDTARCRAGSLDACYDAIRWSPGDPALLVGLGDGLVRAGRPADGIRYYRRAAGMSPSTPGLSAKIAALEAKIAAPRAPRSPAMTAANSKAVVKQFSNAEPETQSH